MIVQKGKYDINGKPNLTTREEHFEYHQSHPIDLTFKVTVDASVQKILLGLAARKSVPTFPIFEPTDDIPTRRLQTLIDGDARFFDITSDEPVLRRTVGRNLTGGKIQYIDKLLTTGLTINGKVSETTLFRFVIPDGEQWNDGMEREVWFRLQCRQHEFHDVIDKLHGMFATTSPLNSLQSTLLLFKGIERTYDWTKPINKDMPNSSLIYCGVIPLLPFEDWYMQNTESSLNKEISALYERIFDLAEKFEIPVEKLTAGLSEKILNRTRRQNKRFPEEFSIQSIISSEPEQTELPAIKVYPKDN